MVWTLFMDMYSGGDRKEKWPLIFIEAPQEEAEIIFQNRFGHNPHRVSCTCCGEDYMVDEYDSLENATAFYRGCEYDEEENKYIEEPAKQNWGHPYKTLEEYLAAENALVIYEKDIKPEERKGSLKTQGYVWID